MSDRSTKNNLAPIQPEHNMIRIQGILDPYLSNMNLKLGASTRIGIEQAENEMKSAGSVL